MLRSGSAADRSGKKPSLQSTQANGESKPKNPAAVLVPTDGQPFHPFYSCAHQIQGKADRQSVRSGHGVEEAGCKRGWSQLKLHRSANKSGSLRWSPRRVDSGFTLSRLTICFVPQALQRKTIETVMDIPSPSPHGKTFTKTL